MDSLEKSMKGMDLFTVEDLSSLISSMKMSKKETISMSDIVSHLEHLKLDKGGDTIFPNINTGTSFGSPEFKFKQPFNILPTSIQSNSRSEGPTSSHSSESKRKSPLSDIELDQERKQQQLNSQSRSVSNSVMNNLSSSQNKKHVANNSSDIKLNTKKSDSNKTQKSDRNIGPFTSIKSMQSDLASHVFQPKIEVNNLSSEQDGEPMTVDTEADAAGDIKNTPLYNNSNRNLNVNIDKENILGTKTVPIDLSKVDDPSDGPRQSDQSTTTQSGSGLPVSGSDISGLRLPENFEFNIGVNDISKNKKSKYISPNKKREVPNENIDTKQNSNLNSYDANHGKDIDDSPPDWWGIDSNNTHKKVDADGNFDNINGNIDDSNGQNSASNYRATIELMNLREDYLKSPNKYSNVNNNNTKYSSRDATDTDDRNNERNTESNVNDDDDHDSDDLDTYINEKIKENSDNKNAENKNIFIGNLQNDDDDDIYSDTDSDKTLRSTGDKNKNLNSNKKTVYDLSHDIDDDDLNVENNENANNKNVNENIDQNLYGDLYSNFLFGKTIEATDKVLQKDYDSDLDDLDDENIVYNKGSNIHNNINSSQKHQHDSKTVFSSSIPSKSIPVPSIPSNFNSKKTLSPFKNPVYNNNSSEYNPKYWSEDPNPFDMQPQGPVTGPTGTGSIGTGSIGTSPSEPQTTETKIFETPLDPSPSFSFGSHPATRRQSGKQSSAYTAYQAYNMEKQMKNNQNNADNIKIFQSVPDVVDLTEDEDPEIETQNNMDIDNDEGRQNNIENNGKNQSRNTEVRHDTNVRESMSDNMGSTIGLAEMYRKEGGDFYAKVDYIRALDSFEKSLKSGPAYPAWLDRPTVLGNRAACLIMLGRYIEAADDCAEALQNDPKIIKLYTRRGRALLKLGHFIQADKEFKKVLELLLLSNRSISTSTLSSSFAYLGLEKDLSLLKNDALNGIKMGENMSNNFLKLGEYENKNDYRGILLLLSDLIPLCPGSIQVYISKCNALNKLHQYEESKICAELFIYEIHTSIQKFNAHKSATFSSINFDKLKWIEKIGRSIVSVDTESVVQILLCMGPSLSHIYLVSLKNIDSCRNCSADIMTRILLILTELLKILKASNTDTNIRDPGVEVTNSMWGWVAEELERTQNLINWKNQGDKQFRSTRHAEAIASYTKAINADPQAVRWGAILYNNRAAANMGVGHLTEAIADCHQAIGRDANYSKAYLRRARALAASLSYAASIRDYRRYLCSDPPPNDMITVNQELVSVVEANRRQVQKDLEKRKQDEKDKRKNNLNNEYNSYKEAPWGDFNRNPYPDPYSAGKSNPYYDIPPPSRGGGANRGFKYNSEGKSNYQSYTGSSSGQTYVVDDSDDDEDEIYEGYTNSKPANSFHNYNKNNKNNNNSKKVPVQGGIQNGGEGCHYHTLGIDYKSDERTIKIAYRKLALKFHPDKNKDPAAEERFKTITSAYSVLIDKVTRDQYDRTRRVGGSSGRHW